MHTVTFEHYGLEYFIVLDFDYMIQMAFKRPVSESINNVVLSTLRYEKIKLTPLRERLIFRYILKNNLWN